jgi:hypothetical protein
MLIALPVPTIDFSYAHSYDSGPDVHLAIVPVRLFSIGNLPITLPALLDTGASFSVFDKAVAGLLGIPDIESGEQRLVSPANEALGSASGYAYLHPVEIEFLSQNESAIGFVPGWDEGIDNLLGM